MDNAVIHRIRGYADDGMSPERIASTLGVPIEDVRRHTVGVAIPLAPGTRPPTLLMAQAWDAYHRHGGFAAADRALDKSAGSARSAVLGYMAATGRRGPIPPPDPSLVVGADQVPAPARVSTPEPEPTTSAPTQNPGADQGAPAAQPAYEAPAVSPVPGRGPGDGDADPLASLGAVRTCASCGCTDDQACPGGCWWVDDPAGDDVCSSCQEGMAEAAGAEVDPIARRVLAMLEAEDIRLADEVRRLDAWIAQAIDQRGALEKARAGVSAARDGYRALLALDGGA